MRRRNGIDYGGIPKHMVDSIQRYIEMGASVGGFLTALLSNDLSLTFGRADETNRAAINGWVTFLWNEAPAGCWGSQEKVAAWQALGGRIGEMQERDERDTE